MSNNLLACSQFGIVDSSKIKGFNKYFDYNNSFFFFSYFFLIFGIFHLCLFVWIGLFFQFNKSFSSSLWNNSSCKNLSSYNCPNGTRIAVEVNMDDKTFHIFHNGKFDIIFLFIYYYYYYYYFINYFFFFFFYF
jgi:hypothetical protein